MSKYITLRCIDCNYEKVYAERLADGHMCPKCNSRLYIPIEQTRITEKEYELLLKRFRHLLESNIIALYDEIDPRTKEYKRDIKKLDILFGQAIKRIIEGEGIKEPIGIYPRSK